MNKETKNSKNKIQQKQNNTKHNQTKTSSWQLVALSGIQLFSVFLIKEVCNRTRFHVSFQMVLFNNIAVKKSSKVVFNDIGNVFSIVINEECYDLLVFPSDLITRVFFVVGCFGFLLFFAYLTQWQLYLYTSGTGVLV